MASKFDSKVRLFRTVYLVAGLLEKRAMSVNMTDCSLLPSSREDGNNKVVARLGKALAEWEQGFVPLCLFSY